ncbi:MAG: HPr kinase/phosphorylase, partial [Gemmatimonadota bacterium]
MTKLTLEEFFNNKRDVLALEVLTEDVGLDREIQGPSISSPGLILAGHTQRAPAGRLQILGETELMYLHSLSAEELRDVLQHLFTLDMPALVVTKGQDVPPLMEELARAAAVPVLRTELKTGEFYRRLQPYLEEEFAPRTTMHGSLADVYGVGLLFVGRSGIGKSECVLDLVERGHRLVADDLVYITRRGNDVLIG